MSELRDLPVIESEALNMLLSGGDDLHEDLRSQLPHVTSVDRTETGAGVYVTFSLGDGARPSKAIDSCILSGVFGVSKKCSEIGFLLYVNEGLIDFLEAYSSDDTYPNYDDCNFIIEKGDDHGNANVSSG